MTLQGVRGLPTEIVGEPGAVVDATSIRGCESLKFQQLTFRGVRASPTIPGLVIVDPSSRGLSFDRCSFSTEESSAGWSPQDWIDRPYGVGLFTRGQNISVSDSRFFNLRNCLYLGGDGSVVKGCSFEAFGNDAIEFCANDLRILSNRIRGGHHTPAEQLHADGIQGFPAPNGGLFSDILIDGNTIEFDGPGDYMQGIVVFDGRWRGIRVTNNSLRLNHWHAITIYGVDDILVAGNTVSTIDPTRRIWIEVRASKEGRPSSGVVVRDNVAPMFRTAGDATTARNKIQLR
ncbi:right-handed parallel beta-helix repeat-containing protein [Methylorubrum extorquens]